MRSGIGQVLALLCWLAASAYGQREPSSPRDLYHTAWTAREGVPSGIVQLAQTSDGILWIAAESGLYQFDGMTFQRFRPSDGSALVSDQVMSLKADAHGGLWIGYRFGGVSFIKDQRCRNYGQAEGLSEASALYFAVDADERVWAATNGGLYRLEGDKWRRVERSWNLGSKQPSAIYSDRAGRLWAISPEGIFYLSAGGHEFRLVQRKPGTDEELGQSADGRMWVSRLGPQGMELGPMEPSGAMPLADSWIHGQFTDVLETRDGGLWLGTLKHGLIWAHSRRETSKLGALSRVTTFKGADGLTSDTVRSIFQDQEGGVFIATDDGLDYFRLQAFVPLPLPKGTQEIAVSRDSDGTLLVGAGNLMHLDGDVVRPLANPVDHIQSIYRDPLGSVWLGGTSLLAQETPTGVHRVRLPQSLSSMHNIQAIATGKTGDVWVSFIGNGVQRYSNGGWQKMGPDQFHKPTAIVETRDESGAVWFGYTNNRVAAFDGTRFATFTEQEGVEVGNVTAIAAYHDHLWIGGDRGLEAFVGGRFKAIRFSGRSPANISGILETSDGRLWLNTVNGVVEVDGTELEASKSNGRGVAHRDFDFLDGFVGAPEDIRPLPTVAGTSDGRLFFSTVHRVYELDPRDIPKNPVIPKVLIRDVVSGGRNCPTNGTVVLPSASDLQVEYTAFSYTVPQRVRFRYRLEGYEYQWHDAGQRRQAFYSKLPPGTYSFHVAASNDDGIWNNDGARVEIAIMAAWYQTAWFRLLCLLALCAVLWAAHRMRLRGISRVLRLRYEARLDERTKIARDLHDTLLQTIQGSKILVETALDQSKDSSRLLECLNKLAAWLDQATKEGRAVLITLRAPDEEDSLVLALKRALDEFSANETRGVDFAVHGSARKMHHGICEQITHIGCEAVRNAYYHSAADRISIELAFGRNLTLRVADNGHGMAEDTLRGGRPGHFGLQGMRERSTAIGSELNIISVLDHGTEVVLTVPGEVVYEREQIVFRKLLSWILSFRD
ncbi:histidine kinase [Granulicella mallensis MP5ACTX8]|uniref:Histidine kinase n=2 Tax=Granulicella mallensis TaxID=940614 RepID=G8P0E8_GRAMM|nr:histidine kinase [Granulicella mallensis MP5ACTX8]